jgi:hypothetical protein
MRQILELLLDQIPFIHNNSLFIGLGLFGLLFLTALIVIKLN